MNTYFQFQRPFFLRFLTLSMLVHLGNVSLIKRRFLLHNIIFTLVRKNIYYIVSQHMQIQRYET